MTPDTSKELSAVLSPAAAPERNQYVTFMVASHFLGIGVLEVQELLAHLEITAVPLAPAGVEGLLNLRGQIVPVVDLRRRLKLPPRAPDQPRKSVVVLDGQGTTSLLVDEIGEVLDMESADLEPPPQNLDGELRELLRGVYRLPDRLLLVLNTQRTIRIEK